MKLMLRFSLIFSVVFGAGLALAAWLGYGLLQQNAREQVVEQAQLMMEAM